MDPPASDADRAPLRYSIKHMLLLTTAASGLFTADRFLGSYCVMLLLGLVTVGTTLSLSRVENPFLGGFLGLGLALLVLCLVIMVGPLFYPADPGLGELWIMILYPLIGYTLGQGFAWNRMICP